MTADAWDRRYKRWVAASHVLAPSEDPWVVIAVQDLAITERYLLSIEEQVSADLRQGMMLREGQPNIRFSECQAHSKLWIMGLYEICRLLINDRKIGKSDCLRSVFDQLEAIRMPLAKHAPRKTTKEVHYPTPCVPLFGHELGWMVKDYKYKDMPSDVPEGTYAGRYISRRQISDLFLHSVDGEW